MFTDKMKTVRMLGVMALAVVMFCSGAFLSTGGESDADTITIDGTDYTTSDITIAPDYKWNYTVQFGEGLDEAVVSVYNDKTDDAIESKVTIASNNRDITVDFSGVSVGNYILVLKAYHAPSDQTTYQAIKFTVVSGIAITPTGVLDKNFVVDEIGTDAYTFDIVTKFGTINTSTIKVDGVAVDASNLTATHDGTEYAEGQKYTVTVDADTATAGKKTITIDAATALGEPGKSVSTYIVYDKLLGGDIDVKPYSDGTSTWNLVPAQTGTADATFTVTATITDPNYRGFPLNFTKDENTLTRNSEPTSSIDSAFLLTLTTVGMVGHEQQKAEYIIHIYDEPAFTLADKSEIVFSKYVEKQVSFVPSTSTTDATWTIDPSTGVTFSNGVATVNSSSTPGEYTVSVSTLAGQTGSAKLTITHEDDFEITGKAPGADDTFRQGAATLGPVVSTSDSGVTRNYGFKADGAVGTVTWTISNEDELPAGVNASIDENGVLHLQSASKQTAFTLSIHAQTESGNYADFDITVTFYNVLSFNAPPTTGCYAYATNE